MAARARLSLLLILLIVGSGCLRELGLGPGPSSEDLVTHPEALLWAAPYKSILVEVDHAPGFEPTKAALDALAKTLFDVTGKPVSIHGPTEIPLQLGGYTGNDILRIHRDTFDHAGPDFGHEGQATLHVLYLDGESHNDTFQGIYVSDGHTAAIALLPAYWVDRVPFYLEQILPGNPREFESRFERAVLIHEAGHALGLVGTIPEVTGRMDPKYPGHSTNPESVMHTAGVPLEENALIALREAGIEPVWRFDADDLADMKAFQRSSP